MTKKYKIKSHTQLKSEQTVKFRLLNSYLIVGNSESWLCVVNRIAPEGLSLLRTGLSYVSVSWLASVCVVYMIVLLCITDRCALSDYRRWSGTWHHWLSCHGSTSSYRQSLSMETTTGRSSWFHNTHSTPLYKWCGYVQCHIPIYTLSAVKNVAVCVWL